MGFNSYLEELNRDLLNNCAGLEKENKKLSEENMKLHEENDHLKKAIEKMRNHLQELHGEIKDDNKIGRYVNGIRNGAFKPRLNKDINEQAVLSAIFKLKTTNMHEIAKVLGVSYSTIRRRLIESKLYPINLQDISDIYILFYSADIE